MENIAARPGFRVVAEIPPGAKTFPVMLDGMQAWIVVRADFAPYYLLADGTRRELDPSPTR